MILRINRVREQLFLIQALPALPGIFDEFNLLVSIDSCLPFIASSLECREEFCCRLDVMLITAAKGSDQVFFFVVYTD